MPKRKALVISPHPDDLEIGMGGTVRVLVEKDVEVISVVVTDGGRSANPMGLTREELVRTREREAEESSRILGVEVFFLGFRDMESRENRSGFESRMRGILAGKRPDEIYVPHPEIDGHGTHRAVSCLCWTAWVRPLPRVLLNASAGATRSGRPFLRTTASRT